MKNARYVHLVDGLYKYIFDKKYYEHSRTQDAQKHCNTKSFQYFCALVNAISCYNNKTE